MPDEFMTLLSFTSDIVAAYLGRNPTEMADVPHLVALVHAALVSVKPDTGKALTAPHRKTTPAEIQGSITHEAIISFEDGKPYRLLKRHLASIGMTPAEYIDKWGLPADYPMTPPSYSTKRSQLARAAGLGLRGRGKPGVAKAAALPGE
jgi:predicted transcriptional regulator